MNKLSTISMVLKQSKYLLIAAVASIGFGFLHYLLSYTLLQDHFALVSDIMPYYFGTSILLLIIVAALAGVNVALIVYKIQGSRINIKKSGGSTVAGSAFAAFTPGCPACTTPMAVILGTVGGLAILPLQGLELKLVSIAALIFSMYWISRGLQQPSCCNIKEDTK